MKNAIGSNFLSRQKLWMIPSRICSLYLVIHGQKSDSWFLSRIRREKHSFPEYCVFRVRKNDLLKKKKMFLEGFLGWFFFVCERNLETWKPRSGLIFIVTKKSLLKEKKANILRKYSFWGWTYLDFSEKLPKRPKIDHFS